MKMREIPEFSESYTTLIAISKGRERERKKKSHTHTHDRGTWRFVKISQVQTKSHMILPFCGL